MLIVVELCRRMSTGTLGCPIVPCALGSHGTFHQSLVLPISHRSGIYTWSLLSIPSHSLTVPWDLIGCPTSPSPSPNPSPSPDQGLVGCSMGILRYHGSMGLDGQEGPRIFQTWDCGMSHGIPGHPTTKLDNPHSVTRYVI